MDEIALYLAGDIPKEHEQESKFFWSAHDRKFLCSQLAPLKLTLLNPADRSDDLSDNKSVFGRDMTQVYLADIVVTLAPRNTHYAKDQIKLLGTSLKDYFHPFVESLSDSVVNDLTETALEINRLFFKKCDYIRS